MAHKFRVLGLSAGLKPKQVVDSMQSVKWTVVPLRTWALDNIATWIVGADNPPPQQVFTTTTGVVTIETLAERKKPAGGKSKMHQKKKEVTKETPSAENDRVAKLVIQPVVSEVPRSGDVTNVLADSEVDKRIAAIENRQDALERKVDAQGSNISSLESTMTSNFARLFELLDEDRGERKKPKPDKA